VASASHRRSRGRPRASGSDQPGTRRQLLDAAAKLIAERGYRGAAVNEVLAEAGLSKGTFYWHFKSKDDMLFALLDERLDRPIRELIERLKHAPPEQDMAPAASERFLELLQRSPETLVLEHEYRSLALRDPALRRRYLERQVALRDALAAGLEARARRLGAPPFSTPLADIATAYLSLTHGLAIERLIDPETVPDHLLGETVALVYQGLVARSEREPP
jgi:AcrR family transcriptional regulator